MVCVHRHPAQERAQPAGVHGRRTDPPRAAAAAARGDRRSRYVTLITYKIIQKS